MKEHYLKFKKNEYLIRQGDPLKRHACIILVGEAKIFHQDERGKNTHIAYIGPRQVVGEVSLLGGEPYSASAIATMPTICRIIAPEQMPEFIQSQNPFVSSLLRLMSSRYHSLLQDYTETTDDTQHQNNQ